MEKPEGKGVTNKIQHFNLTDADNFKQIEIITDEIIIHKNESKNDQSKIKQITSSAIGAKNAVGRRLTADNESLLNLLCTDRTHEKLKMKDSSPDDRTTKTLNHNEKPIANQTEAAKMNEILAMIQINELNAVFRSPDQHKRDSLAKAALSKAAPYKVAPSKVAVVPAPLSDDNYEDDVKSLDPSTMETQLDEVAPRPFSEGGSIQAMAAAVMRRSNDAATATTGTAAPPATGSKATTADGPTGKAITPSPGSKVTNSIKLPTKSPTPGIVPSKLKKS